MHEWSLCRSLLTQLEKICKQESATGIARVYLRVGPFAGVEPDLLQTAFTLSRGQSVAAGAELVIETTPLRVHCPACNDDFQVPRQDLRCPKCRDTRAYLISGEELVLASVDLIEPPTLNSGDAHV